MIPYREEDIRQSDGWGKYLESVGWKLRKTSRNILIAIRPTFIGNFVKIQHPVKFNADDLKEIESICRDEKCTYIKIEPDYDQDLSLLDSSGYRLTHSPNCVPSTIFIDLSLSEDALKNRLSDSARYSLNRAIREDYKVVVHKKPSEGLLKESYEIFARTARLKNFYLTPFREFTIRGDLFGEKSYLCAVYDRDGNIQSSKFCLGHKNMVLYVAGGTIDSARKNKSGYLLMWDSMKYFKSEGYDVFDLEGRDDPRFSFHTRNWGGFSHFKDKFNGIDVEFPIPRIKFLNSVYGVVSKLMHVDF